MDDNEGRTSPIPGSEMTGWIIAGCTALVAAIAIGTLWRRHRRELRRLESSRRQAVAEREDEHRRRVDRIRREHDRRLETAHHGLAQDLFPVLDSLDEACDHSEDNDQLSVRDLREGLELARQELYTALARHGIEAIEPRQGEAFDPSCHEAIARTESDEADDGAILRRFRRGYRDGDQVLRPALVEVNVAPDQREESSSVPDDEPPAAESDDEGPSADPEDADSPDRPASGAPPPEK